jgi:DNA-binding NarL/FixJ family response regulator
MPAVLALETNQARKTLESNRPSSRTIESTCAVCERNGYRETVAILEAAFEHNPLPGIILRPDGPHVLNAAARALFDREAAPADFLRFVRSAAYSSPRSSPPLRASGRRFDVATSIPLTPELPSSTRICFLLERASATTHAESMADRCDLTGAQRRIVALLSNGFTNREIGRELGIAAETVRKQMGRILAKTGCRTRTAVVAAAMAGGGDRA